jgi:hypothetical protein
MEVRDDDISGVANDQNHPDSEGGKELPPLV